MVCPYCGGATDVINSREQKKSNRVWRRRQCQACNTVFTTHESAYLEDLYMVGAAPDKATQFDPNVLFAEIVSCLRHRQRSYSDAKEITAVTIQKCLKRASNGLIRPQDISQEAAQVLKRFDKQGYLRFYAEHPSLQS